jgi:ABC-type branched-subunit amino acid transport system permease subunit
MVQYLEGVLQLAAVFLALVAGFFAASLLKVSHQNEHLKPWKYLIVALILFALEEILGALVAFKIILPTFLTHIVPTAILIMLILALNLQIKENTSKKGDL